MQFIVSGQRIATENFVTGKLYTILFKNDTQVNLMCISIGADCVVFQGEAPLNLFTLTMQNADTIDTIEPTQLGTTNYNNLINKPQINGVDLIGNKTSSALGIRDVPAIIEADDGKILTANSDGTYTWQPAPSSGTMDYTQLNNKPQINSVTLTGNVSLADLGAAAAADIPTTPAEIGAEPAITSENMLDADLVDDTSSTHKFATAAQLAQIGTNENNISLVQGAIVSINQLIATLHPVSITTQPSDVSAVVDETANFAVVAVGVGLTYQWYYNQPNWQPDDFTLTTLPTSKTSTLSVPAAASRNGNKYKCVVTDINNQTATSNAATLTVT